MSLNLGTGLSLLQLGNESVPYYVSLQPSLAGRSSAEYVTSQLQFNPATGTLITSNISSPIAFLTSASVTSLTFSTGTVSGSILPSANVSVNLGSPTAWWNLVYGRSVQAQYADLAENYTADNEYLVGTVVVFGGEKEITITTLTHDTCVAGVISTNPAYLMNAVNEGLPVALTGRVPCKVHGPVNKGTVLVTSETPGVACAINYDLYKPGCVLGKSLDSIKDDSIQTIEIVVGRF